MIEVTSIFFIQILLFLSTTFFYYLGELNDSLLFALGAGPLFDVSEDSDYIHTLLSKNFHVHPFFSNMNAAIYF